MPDMIAQIYLSASAKISFDYLAGLVIALCYKQGARQMTQASTEMTRTEALTLALKLAVQAPTQAKSDAALKEARCIAAAMSFSDVADAKKAAQEAVKYARQQGAEG